MKHLPTLVLRGKYHLLPDLNLLKDDPCFVMFYRQQRILDTLLQSW
jgi:hypothetical protein